MRVALTLIVIGFVLLQLPIPQLYGLWWLWLILIAAGSYMFSIDIVKSKPPIVALRYLRNGVILLWIMTVIFLVFTQVPNALISSIGYYNFGGLLIVTLIYTVTYAMVRYSFKQRLVPTDERGSNRERRRRKIYSVIIGVLFMFAFLSETIVLPASALVSIPLTQPRPPLYPLCCAVSSSMLYLGPTGVWLIIGVAKTIITIIIMLTLLAYAIISLSEEREYGYSMSQMLSHRFSRFMLSIIPMVLLIGMIIVFMVAIHSSFVSDTAYCCTEVTDSLRDIWGNLLNQHMGECTCQWDSNAITCPNNVGLTFLLAIDPNNPCSVACSGGMLGVVLADRVFGGALRPPVVTVNQTG